MTLIGYVLVQPWTRAVLLTDGTWGDAPDYDDRVELFTCRVKAERRARTCWQQVAVCPWELESAQSYSVVSE